MVLSSIAASERGLYTNDSLHVCIRCLEADIPERLKSPEWAAKRNEVDLKRADLERTQHDLDLFGSNPADQAAKNRAVYFLLRVCLEIEQSMASS